jgi:hypothetical protein
MRQSTNARPDPVLAICEVGAVFTRDIKVARAHEHIAAVKQLAEEWLATDAYTITREIDPEMGHTICKARIKSSPPIEIGPVVGDAVHNLRSALDHAVYALAERHHGGPLPIEVQESLMFPIVGNQDGKGNAADGAAIFRQRVVRLRLADWLPDNVLAYIDSIQPYRWPRDEFRYHWLWLVHDLDRIDKHRRIHVTTAWISLPFVTSPGDPTLIDIQWGKAGNSPVSDGDVLVTFSGAEEGVEAHLSRAIAINDGPAQIQEVGSLLELLARRVEVYVACLTGEISGPVWP